MYILYLYIYIFLYKSRKVGWWIEIAGSVLLGPGRMLLQVLFMKNIECISWGWYFIPQVVQDFFHQQWYSLYLHINLSPCCFLVHFLDSMLSFFIVGCNKKWIYLPRHFTHSEASRCFLPIWCQKRFRSSPKNMGFPSMFWHHLRPKPICAKHGDLSDGKTIIFIKFTNKTHQNSCFYTPEK